MISEKGAMDIRPASLCGEYFQFGFRIKRRETLLFKKKEQLK